MKVRNVHERSLPAGSNVGELIDSLASPDDGLWPWETWPPMRLDRPLGNGAAGGHGPVRYVVETHVPGRSVRFRFTAPKGFCGTHAFEVVPIDPGTMILRHTLEMRATGRARLTWPLVFRPLHDALVEDALAKAQARLGQSPRFHPWSRRVRLLRWLLSKGRAAPQTAPALDAHRRCRRSGDDHPGRMSP